MPIAISFESASREGAGLCSAFGFAAMNALLYSASALAAKRGAGRSYVSTLFATVTCSSSPWGARSYLHHVEGRPQRTHGCPSHQYTLVVVRFAPSLEIAPFDQSNPIR